MYQRKRTWTQNPPIGHWQHLVSPFKAMLSLSSKTLRPTWPFSTHILVLINQIFQDEYLYVGYLKNADVKMLLVEGPSRNLLVKLPPPIYARGAAFTPEIYCLGNLQRHSEKVESGSVTCLWNVKLGWIYFVICSVELEAWGVEEDHKRSRSRYTHAPQQRGQNLCCLRWIYHQVSCQKDL